ncbi:MAG: glutamate--tRNA ligase [Leptospiraceae bacterium]|nr:glutamate--tRNA ligase [Leptospiraceae bacterium]MDW8307442.1 glutamate--tRNA ligase [Leptospiraceae bacterium]
MDKVRTRFAPSPTGYLHVGGARTALFNYLYARARGGKFILRIEDTDQERSTEESYAQVLESLRWLGLNWDEGPEVGGPHGPYRQSQRLPIYREHAERLIQEGKAYPCFCTSEELEIKKAQREAMGLPAIYDGKCRHLSSQEVKKKIEAGFSYTIRFRTPPGKIVVHDLVQGQVYFDSSLIGDFIIIKSDGFPSYNYAVVVDDHLMEISHVIRGVQHLSNTPRQILLYQAFGWQEPKWAHVSEIVGSDHKKLSKRHGATPITAFRDLGYPARAFNNYMALLGWSPPDGQEFRTMEELCRIFDIERCSKSPAMFDVFDLEKAADQDLSALKTEELENYLFPKSKLNWLSNLHIRHCPEEQYLREVMPFVQKSDFVAKTHGEIANERLREILLALRVYLDYYRQILRYLSDFFVDFDEKTIDDFAEEIISSQNFLSIAETFHRLIKERGGEDFTAEAIKNIIAETGRLTGHKGKNLYMTLRIACTGKKEGLELPQYLALLGYQKVEETLRKTIALAKERWPAGSLGGV